MSAVAETLRRARALIERGWCQGQMRDGNCVCLYGAIDAAIDDGAPIFGWEDPIWRELIAATDGQDPIRWNDAPERTQAEVLAAFDRAIEIAERGETL